MKPINQLDITETENKILTAKNKKVRKIRYAALIQKLKKLRIQRETEKEKEPVMVTETRQETGNSATNEEDDEEIPSFQQSREEEAIELFVLAFVSYELELNQKSAVKLGFASQNVMGYDECHRL